jgi:hypothetical protein
MKQEDAESLQMVALVFQKLDASSFELKVCSVFQNDPHIACSRGGKHWGVKLTGVSQGFGKNSD